VVTRFDEEFRARAEVHSATRVKTACVGAHAAGDGWAVGVVDADIPEWIADRHRSESRRGKKQLAIVESIAAGNVCTESFLLDELVSRVHRQAPHAKKRTVRDLDVI